MNGRLVNQQRKMLDRIRAQAPELAQQLNNLKIGWFKLKNAADGETTDLYIYDEIMPKWMADFFGGVSAEGLIEELNASTASVINVRINSPGGAIFEAVAIHSALMSHSATINVYVDALAASAASIVAMAGDTITMMPGSQMMIHDALGVEMGNAADMRAFADFLDKQSDNLASIYANKAGGEIADWRAVMLAETWMFAQEAVDMGLADGIYSATPPDESEEETPEEEQTEETQEQEQEEDNPDEQQQENDEDEELENLMSRRHSLVNRGFKYNGRRRAPEPESISDTELDSIVAKWNAFGRK